MSILLIADLHLNEERRRNIGAFLSFLQTKAMHCEALYILGDFFHLWIGDDGMNDFSKMIASHLRQLADSGVKIYLMHGNRDFTIGKKFCRLAGCTLLPDPVKVNFYGQAVLLSHGDIFCTNDVGYQKARRLVRNPLLLPVLKRLPLKFRQYMASRMQASGRKYKQKHTVAIMDVTPEVIPLWMQKYQTQLLIHGHTHRPAIHQLCANDKPAQRIVLGDWEPNGKVLRVTPQGFALEDALTS